MTRDKERVKGKEVDREKEKDRKTHHPNISNIVLCTYNMQNIPDQVTDEDSRSIACGRELFRIRMKQ